MLRVETPVETNVYIVVFAQCSSLVEYLGCTAKVKAASSKKEAKRVEERVAEEVTMAT